MGNPSTELLSILGLLEIFRVTLMLSLSASGSLLGDFEIAGFALSFSLLLDPSSDCVSSVPMILPYLLF